MSKGQELYPTNFIKGSLSKTQMNTEDFRVLAYNTNRERVRLTLHARLGDPESTFVLEGRLGGSYEGHLIVNAPYIEDMSKIHSAELKDLIRREYTGGQKQIAPGFIQSYQFLEVVVRK